MKSFLDALCTTIPRTVDPPPTEKSDFICRFHLSRLFTLGYKKLSNLKDLDIPEEVMRGFRNQLVHSIENVIGYQSKCRVVPACYNGL
jgi:hypothetical protein